MMHDPTMFLLGYAVGGTAVLLALAAIYPLIRWLESGRKRPRRSSRSRRKT